jgi:hypothetical protein
MATGDNGGTMANTTPTETAPAPAKRELSPAELQQRRDAAAHSTGPRTEEGKARSSRNAWKHGMSSAVTKLTFGQAGAASMAALFGKPCQTTCPLHPDNPNAPEHPCSLVLDGLTRAGGNCLDKSVYVTALAALADALESGEMSGVQSMLAAEGGKVMQLLHELMQSITTNGLLIAIPMVTKEGNVVYDRNGKEVIADFKPNPMIPAYIKLLADFGISLPEMLATPQARSRAKTGEQAADSFQSLLGGIMQRAQPLPAPQRPALEHDE